MGKASRIFLFSMIILIYVAALTAGFSGCNCNDDNYKYTIKDGKDAYYTNTFEKDANGCITFINDPKGDHTSQTICGSYTITSNTAKSEEKHN